MNKNKTSDRFQESNEDEHTLPSYMRSRKVWKTVGTFDSYKDADEFRKSQLGEAKVRLRADGSFDVKVLAKRQ